MKSVDSNPIRTIIEIFPSYSPPILASQWTRQRQCTNGSSAPRQTNALALMEKLGKWDSIYYLLRVVRDSDEAIADMSRFAIQLWLAQFNGSLSSPTAEQLARFR